MHLSSNPNVAAIILAAGNSKRMGFPKALLPLDGSTFIETIALKLQESGIQDIVATLPTGKIGQRILDILLQWPIRSCENIFPQREMLGSVQSVLLQDTFNADAALICPVDMPFLSFETIHQFLDAYEENKESPTIVCIHSQGKRGHPMLLSHHFFGEILELGDTHSLQNILQKYEDCIVPIESKDARLLLNINTPEDYDRGTKPSLSTFDAEAIEAPGVKSL